MRKRLHFVCHKIIRVLVAVLVKTVCLDLNSVHHTVAIEDSKAE